MIAYKLLINRTNKIVGINKNYSTFVTISEIF